MMFDPPLRPRRPTHLPGVSGRPEFFHLFCCIFENCLQRAPRGLWGLYFPLFCFISMYFSPFFGRPGEGHPGWALGGPGAGACLLPAPPTCQGVLAGPGTPRDPKSHIFVTNWVAIRPFCTIRVGKSAEFRRGSRQIGPTPSISTLFAIMDQTNWGIACF